MHSTEESKSALLSWRDGGYLKREAFFENGREGEILSIQISYDRETIKLSIDQRLHGAVVFNN